MQVEIAPHEKEAMYSLVLAARAIAGVLKDDDQQKAKLLNWAGMVEDVVERLDLQ